MYMYLSLGQKNSTVFLQNVKKMSTPRCTIHASLPSSLIYTIFKLPGMYIHVHVYMYNNYIQRGDPWDISPMIYTSSIKKILTKCLTKF